MEFVRCRHNHAYPTFSLLALLPGQFKFAIRYRFWFHDQDFVLYHLHPSMVEITACFRDNELLGPKASHDRIDAERSRLHILLFLYLGILLLPYFLLHKNVTDEQVLWRPQGQQFYELPCFDEGNLWRCHLEFVRGDGRAYIHNERKRIKSFFSICGVVSRNHERMVHAGLRHYSFESTDRNVFIFIQQDTRAVPSHLVLEQAQSDF